jgi:hypothetical protein
VVVSVVQIDDTEEEKESNNQIPKSREGGQAVARSGKALVKKTRPSARFTVAA